MRTSQVFVLALFALACRRAPPRPPDPVEVDQTPPPAPIFVGPGQWSDPASFPLRVEVPPGWEAWRGEADPVVLRLFLREGVEILFLTAKSLDPREHETCAWISIDRIGRVLDAPALGQATLATCAPIESDGSKILAWLAVVDAQPIHLEAHLAPGEWVDGRDEVLGVLAGLQGL
ncbi:MAG: hypothetical protein EA397_14780 [Deltaproteobacteria bacterium]|nr:MAG: hypothetical protein EA397_14780 [Deltaproteobacteria bacterium]